MNPQQKIMKWKKKLGNGNKESIYSVPYVSDCQ